MRFLIKLILFGFAAVFGLLIVLGTMAELQIIPDTVVLEGEALSQRTVTKLQKAEILLPDEQVAYFYSAALFNVLNDGNILTDQRAISYAKIDGVLEVFAATFEEIDTVRMVEKGDFLEDTVVEVLLKDQSGFYLLLSAEEDRDKDFIQALRARIPIQFDKTAEPILKGAEALVGETL